MKISYQREQYVDPKEVAVLFEKSGIKRPYEDLGRVGRMVQNANLIICARDGARLVGIARALTDFSYACYLSDLAVDENYQGHGIGTELIRLTKETVGEESMLLLLSAPTATSYYAQIDKSMGLELKDNAWLIPRKK